MSITRDRRGHRVVVAMAAIVGIAWLPAAPAQAGSDTAAVCTLDIPVVTISPPFYPFVLAPATGTVTTGGQTGTVNCVGKIDGAQVTGPGTVGAKYTYSNGSCVGHVGLGTVTWVIPTAAGSKQVTGTLHVRRIGLALLVEPVFPDARGQLEGVVVPIQGDCVLTPLSKGHVILAGPLVAT